VGWLGLGGANPFELNGADRLGNPFLQKLNSREGPRLINERLVQLIVLLLQVRQGRLNLLEPMCQCFVHARTLKRSIEEAYH
jgi:hypothetical protein